MLEVTNLHHAHLGPLDLRLEAGECVSISGPSGAGKSLLLRAIADLDPAQGEVSLNGTDRNAMPAPEWRKRVGFLAAEPGWWAERVGDHFADGDREKATGLFGRVGLAAEAMDWEVRRASTGEKQRIALIRMIIGQPKVLLLDEPTSALDEDSTRIVETILREILSKGAGIIVVTHDRDQAERLAKRHCRIETGRLSEVTAP